MLDIEQMLLALVALVFVVALFYLFYPAIHALNRNTYCYTKPFTLRCCQHKPILSLIIPAYDEEVRLPKMLQEAYEYLSRGRDCRALKDLASLRTDGDGSPTMIPVEWIVVSDGSRDRTAQIYRDFVEKTSNMTWKLIEFPQNEGKGAAVRAGMLEATGDFCLMVDADGATDFGPGLEALTARLLKVRHKKSTAGRDHRHPIIVLGSRAHLQDTQTRSAIRSFLMHAFHICVMVFVGAADIRDTQCGFKLFDNATAHHLFQILHLRRWAFDTEMVYLAKHLNYGLQEVVVPWQEVEGSKLHTSALNLALVSIGMLRDMICVRLCYTLGLWKIRRKAQ